MGWPGARARRGPGGLGRRPSATCRRDPARPRGERAARTRRAGRRGAGVAAPAGPGLARTAGRARQVRRALGGGSALRRAARGCGSPRRRRAPPPPDGPSPSPPAQSPPRRCAAPRPSPNLGAALRPQPGPELPERGAVPGRPPPRPGPRLGRAGRHLPREAPGGRGRRALGGSFWSARGAEERAPLRLFPETPPGGVRPAGPGRLLTPAATLLPARPGQSPSRALPLRAPRRRLRPR